MAGKPDNFQLLEFQPKTVYLPDHGRNTGSLRRPPSAEDRRDQEPRYQMHPAVHPVRENEYARVPRRSSYDNREIMYPREQDLPHPPEGMRQPLLQNPVYLLVPAGSMEGPGGKYPSDTFYARADGGPVLEEPGIRRRRTYVRERVVEPYPEKRGCCSCWRCMIALIVILTIIGVGLAVTGIVFIKLINQQQQGQTGTYVHGDDNGTSPHEGSVRQASFPMTSDSVPMAFDVNVALNGTDANMTTTATDGSTTFVIKITSNGTFDVQIPASDIVTTSTPNTTVVSVNGTFVMINGTNSTGQSIDTEVVNKPQLYKLYFMGLKPTMVQFGSPSWNRSDGVDQTKMLSFVQFVKDLDMNGVRVLEVALHPNGSMNLTLQHNAPPQSTAVVVESETLNPLIAAMFGVDPDGASFDVDTSTTAPPVSGIAFSANMGVVPAAAAFLSKNLSDVAVAHVAVHPNGTMIAPSATPHHNDSEHLPTPQNLTLAQVGSYDTHGHAQRAAEEAHRANIYADWNLPVGQTKGAAANSSGAAVITNRALLLLLALPILVTRFYSPAA